MTSEVVETGTRAILLLQSHYAAGDNVLLEYRHGASQAACEAAGWNTYTAQFSSAGFVQIRVTN